MILQADEGGAELAELHGIDALLEACEADTASQDGGPANDGTRQVVERNRNTVEFLGIWETLHNPNFNPLEFEGFRKEAGLNAFTLSPTRWIEATNAIGIVSQAGRYGGTFVQTDIAFEFASWISVEFRLYLVMEFQRLKAKEQELLGWTAKRELSKINYRIHTDAIKSHLIPEEITPAQAVCDFHITVYDRKGNAYTGMLYQQPSRRDSSVGWKYVHLRNCNGDIDRYNIRTGEITV